MPKVAGLSRLVKNAFVGGGGLILGLALTCATAGAQTTITNTNIGTYAPLDGSEYYLDRNNPSGGNYIIDGVINLYNPTQYDFKIDNAASQLTIDGRGKGTSHLFEVRNFTFGSGTLNVYSADNGLGLRVWNDFIHDGSGVLSAVGVGGSNQHALNVGGSYTHSGSGDIVAVGSETGNSAGIYVAADFEHTGTGTITATGNSANGIRVYGTLSAAAGSGIIRATGGSALFGLDVTNMTLNSELQTFRTSSTAAVNVSGGNLNFGSTSVWRPAIDLTKTESEAAGLISVGSNTVVTISAGAELRPIFSADTSGLGVGQTFSASLLQRTSSGTGTISTTDFVLPTFSPTMSYTSTVTTDNYTLNITRTHTPGQAVTDKYGETNAVNLFDAISTIPAGSTGVPGSLRELYDNIDNLTTEEFAGYVNRVQLGLTPHDATRLPFFFRRQSDAAQAGFEFQISRFTSLFNQPTDMEAGGYGRPAQAVSAGYGGPADSWRLWLTPMFQQSSHYNGGNREFTGAQEKFGGAAFGLGKDFGQLILGAQIHYLHGQYESAYTDADSDSFGLTLGGRLHNLACPGGWFDPVVDFSAAYVHGDIDQDRRDLFGFVSKSSPDSDLFRAGFALGNRFLFNDSFIMTPMIGLDYVHVRQDGYAESGPGGFGHRVAKASYDSLRPKIGFDLEASLTPKLSATGRAYYRYETMDRNINLHSQFLGSPATAFKTEGHKYGRSSGDIGFGLNYQATDSLSLQAGYDLIVEDEYLGNKFMVGLNWSF